MTGYAKVGGQHRRGLAQARELRPDILWQLAFRDLTIGKVRSAETFREAMASSPFTFNIGYADDRDIAMYSAGRLPLRDPRVDPRLPTRGHRRVRVARLFARRASARTRSTRPAASS